MTKFSKSLISVLFLIGSISSAVLGATVPQVTTLSPVTEGVSTPLRIATDPVGNFYVTDPRGGGVLKYSSAGKLLQVIATAKPPQGIALTRDGRLVVSEGDQAVLMDTAGTELRKLGSGAGQFGMANGIAVDAAGFIYVVDSLADSVQVFNAAGDFSFRFGTAGNQPGQFSMPTGIAYEKVSNQLAVADTLNGRVQFFNLSGVYQKSIGSSGSGPLKFTFPEGIAFEYTSGPVPVLNRIYVVDAFQSNLQALDPTGSGAFLGFIGSYGSGSGQLMGPVDAVFDQLTGRLIVTNGTGNLALFGIDQKPAQGDTVSPVLTMAPLPASTSAASLLVSGTVEAGASVTVSVNGAAAMAAAVAGTDWNATVSLASGANTITVKARDVAGNVTTLTGVTTLAVSTTVTIDPVVSLTSGASQTIGGTMAAGATVAVTTGTTAVAGTVAYPTATSWRSVISALAEGDNVITATARTSAGASTAVAATITRDATAPALTLSALADGRYSASRLQNVSGHVADSHLDKVMVNGVPARVASGFFSAAVELVNGANSITVTASDLAGNAMTDTRTIHFDPARPLLTISSPADGVATRTPLLTLTGTVAPNSTVSVNGSPAAITGTGWSATVNLTAGLNTIDVSARDLAGNVTTRKRTVVLDSTRPDLAIGTPGEDSAANSGTLAISGTAAADSALTYAVNGVPAPLALVNGSFSFTAQFPAEGGYAITVTATDAAGNASVTTRNVTYDKIPPALTINPADMAAPTALSGMVDPHATVSAADSNGPVGNVVTTGGTWSLDMTGLGYDQATLAVTAVDAAGNATARTLANTGPDGDLNGDGTVTIADALRALRLAVKVIEPTANDFIHGDIGPLANGSLSPDGTIGLVDALLILRKAVGVQSW